MELAEDKPTGQEMATIVQAEDVSHLSIGGSKWGGTACGKSARTDL